MKNESGRGMDMNLDPEILDEVDGSGDELINILKTKGKRAAVSRCCELYPDYCEACAQAVSEL